MALLLEIATNAKAQATGREIVLVRQVVGVVLTVLVEVLRTVLEEAALPMDQLHTVPEEVVQRLQSVSSARKKGTMQISAQEQRKVAEEVLRFQQQLRHATSVSK